MGEISADAVAAHLGDASPQTLAELQPAVDAVNAWVGGFHPESPWSAAIHLGAVMLAATISRRRNTPSGVEVFGDGGIAHVARSDPHVSQLLGLGGWTRPQVG